MKASASFIRSEGGLLPADLLARIRARDSRLPGIKPAHYGLVPGETLNEAASRSWARLTGLWRRFAQKLTTRPADQGFEADTLDLWLRPLFQELGFPQPLERARAETLGRDTFAISHRSGDLPIHLVGAGILLDKRTRGVRGAADVNPHGLLQDYLNRKDSFVWGLLSNGLRLRLLRDNAALTRQAFVEFDLEAIFSAEDQSGYADFFLLWLVCHRTRFNAIGGGPADATTPPAPAAWIIESWRAEALKTGKSVKRGLRNNVVQALNHLAPGFVSHRANAPLRDALRSGALSRDAFKRQLLRLIYRLLFLFVAEDRGALFAPDATFAARERFASSYSTARLRRLARRYGGTAHGDGWEQLKTLFGLLHSDTGCPALGLPALGGFLFSTASCPDLDRARLANADLYAALRALGLARDEEENITHVVDYEHLGAEELGSVYESLLELRFVEGSIDAERPVLDSAAGNDRKLTGSFYTPTELITSVLDTALQPVIDRALASANPREALLALKVVDGSCGSGHFLVAAAHRLARALAALDTGEREPPLDAVRSALHEVVGRCLFGVDLNPLSVELCKVSLWLEALEPGRPLNFLESHIQCGNSLIGCTPRLLREGLPDDAFKPIVGDDAAACAQLKKDNREARDAGQDLLGLANATPAPWERLGNLPAAFAAIETLDDDSIGSVRQKEQAWQQAVVSSGYLHATLLHDAWCAAFVLPKRNEEFTLRLHTGQLRELERTPFALHPDLRRAIEKLGGNAPDLPDADREHSYRFFHWHLRFPGVFRLPAANEAPDNPETGWSGGFDVVLGNPPWEHTELKEKEFFATRAPAISAAQTGAERKQLIATLADHDPALYAEFLASSRAHEGVSHFLSNSGAYPLCGRGRINTYSIFSELNLELTAPTGRAGFIVPTGIATDDGNKFYFQKLVDERRLASLFDFENQGIFEGVHNSYKFSLLTITGRADQQPTAKFFFFAHGTDELADPDRQIELTPEDILRINPNTRTCPIFRTRRDADITRRIYSQVPVLLREANAEGEGDLNPWGVRFRQGLFNMTSASHLFFTRPKAEAEGWEFVGNRWRKGDDTLLPLYEAKLFHQFDHRWATYLESASTFNPITGDEENDGPETRDHASGEKTDPALTIQPRYWVDERWCLLIAADLPGEVTDAVRRALEESLGLAKAGKRNATMSTGDQLRRELGRWLSGHRLADGSFAVADADLRDLIALDQKKRPTAKKWKEELEAARAIAGEFPLTAEEADSLGQLLTASLAEKLRRIWRLFHSRAPKWFLSYRRIARSTDTRTCISSAVPFAALGDITPIVRTSAYRASAYALLANFDSQLFDFIVRQKVGGTHLDFHYVYQFPVLPPETYTQPAPWAPGLTLADWLRPYVLELCYTANDLRGFAEDCGFTGAPFRWNDTRRALLRAELDAAFFHLYGLNRDDTAYVLGTFTVLKNRELRDLGRYETADRILAAHDALSAAIATGQPFTTKLVPPPADPSLTHDHSTTRPAMPARLVRATISNYRSLSGPWNDSTRQKADPLTPVIVPLGRMTLLVGQNSAGKSSFCDALAFITDIMRRGLPAAIDNGDNRKGIVSLRRQGGDTLCIRLDAEAEGIVGHYELELTATNDGYRVVKECAQWKASFAIKSGEWQGEPLAGASVPPGPTDLLMPLLRNDPRFRELGELLAGMVVYSVPPSVLRQSRSNAPARPMDGRGEDWPSALEAVLSGPNRASLIVALNRLTGDIVDVRVETAAKQRIVRFLHRPPEMESGERWANADQESDGTLRAAALLTALLQDPLPAVIAIEEPELAIHPGALEILFDFLQSAHQKTQVIVTTHSPDLLDRFEPELVRVVIRDGVATQITAMEADQYYAVKKGLTTLGAMLRTETLRLGQTAIPSLTETEVDSSSGKS
jgi:predicted ATPase